MAKTVDAATMRQINKRYVTEYIYTRAPISRIDISTMTGLNKATVSSLVDELISEQFVVETGYGTSNGGRKPVMLQFNAKAGYCIGVDVQITHMKTVLTDIMGNIVYKRIRPMDAAPDHLTQAVLEELLLDEIDRAAAQAPPSTHGIIGAGIALPGIVNFKAGCAFYLPNIEIHNWDVVGALSNVFSFPIFIDNDGNCGAWSEYRNRHVDNLVFVNVGIGIGTGIIVGGRLYRGANGIAGEYGHTTISAIGVPCACGNYGCWEQYASEQALLRYLSEGEEVPESLELSPNLVALAVEEATQRATYRRAFETVGQYLGIGIANIVNALNPDLVVVGGTMAQGAHLFESQIAAVLKHRAMSFNKQVPVAFADEDTIVVGAARMPVWNTILQSPLSET
ncbi:ROK family protein [Alicyclobacillus dauci]|uniref:ROK family protein n=1 Tax=Alicyclobacillus dauci TaxID=1475485 RepID=A0ABY6Z2Y9_9BACL|nr:ROK family protein [Alicyclobacillus dauci]WAH37245.1 ROK family protein [Alicyclobacillus dauci]